MPLITNPPSHSDKANKKNMKIDLIKGTFSAQEAADLISQLIQVKIKFHEDKIDGTQHEEDIKMRENRIKLLQNNLAEVKQYIKENGEPIALSSTIQLNEHEN